MTTVTAIQTLRRRMLYERKTRGLTIREFAELTGLSTGRICGIETGKSTSISIRKAEQVALKLGLPAHDLFTPDPERETQYLPSTPIKLPEASWDIIHRALKSYQHELEDRLEDGGVDDELREEIALDLRALERAQEVLGA